jgi:hypothetical protein
VDHNDQRSNSDNPDVATLIGIRGCNAPLSLTASKERRVREKSQQGVSVPAGDTAVSKGLAGDKDPFCHEASEAENP